VIRKYEEKDAALIKIKNLPKNPIKGGIPANPRRATDNKKA